jgi:Cu-Zn family superoxide dismutase
MRHTTTICTAAALSLGAVLIAGAQEPAGTTGARDPMMVAHADMKNAQGESIGRAELKDTPNGVLITLRLDRAPEGEHAFHIHEVGRCEAPAFESAGGHFNPTGAGHGFLDPKGPHAGDLPNVHVGSDGRLHVELFADEIGLATGERTLFDDNGSAVVLHAKPDDYQTNPAGDAGDRLACGVVMKGK